MHFIYLDRLSLSSVGVHTVFVYYCCIFFKNENLTRIQQNGKPVGYYHPFLDVFSIWIDNKGNLLTSQWCKKQEQGFGYKELVFAGRTAAKSKRRCILKIRYKHWWKVITFVYVTLFCLILMLSNSLTIVFISSHTCTNKPLIFSQSVPYSCARYSVFITKASYPNVVVMLTCRYMTFWFHCKFLIPLGALNIQTSLNMILWRL